MSSTSNLKSRHYVALASRLRHLRTNLSETEVQLSLMAERLQDMSKLGISSGAQFMAVSRLLDKELQEATAAEEAAPTTGAGSKAQ